MGRKENLADVIMYMWWNRNRLSPPCSNYATMPYHNAEAELGWSENCDWINIIILEMIYYWYNLSISDEYLMRLWIIVVGPNPIVIHILYMQTLYITFRFRLNVRHLRWQRRMKEMWRFSQELLKEEYLSGSSGLVYNKMEITIWLIQDRIESVWIALLWADDGLTIWR